MRPFKTASCRGAREVVELAAGECERRGLEVGDRIAWASRTVADELELRERPREVQAEAEVILASDDQRFIKLARFLLDGHGIGVASTVRPENLLEALTDEKTDAVLLDADDALGDALRLSNTVRAGYQDLPIVLVGTGAAERAPDSVAVYDKWEQLDEAIADLEARLGAVGP